MTGSTLDNIKTDKQMGSKDENELPIQSCKALASFLSTINTKDQEAEQIRLLIIKDLIFRLKNLKPFDRAEVIGMSWFAMLPEELKLNTFLAPNEIYPKNSDLKKAIIKVHKNIAIFTILQTELEAVLLALHHPNPEQEDEIIGSQRYWYKDIQTNEMTTLTIVVTINYAPRNIPCVISMSQLLESFDIDLMLMIGIAAGPKNYVKLSDVVFADQILDYEHVRLEVSKLGKFWGLYHFVGKQLRKLLKKDKNRLQYFPVGKNETTAKLLRVEKCQNFFLSLIKEVDGKKIPEEYKNIDPSFHIGTIAAGEKLIADGSLQRMCDLIDQKIRAGDQEDSGFAQFAIFKKIRYCIFRGISDYGDPNKENGYQFISSLAAASFAIAYLQNVWRLKE